MGYYLLGLVVVAVSAGGPPPLWPTVLKFTESVAPDSHIKRTSGCAGGRQCWRESRHTGTDVHKMTPSRHACGV